MRSFSVLPWVLLMAFILYTTLPACEADEHKQSNQNKQSNEDHNKKASEEESCEEGDKDCEEVSCEEGDKDCVKYESCEEGEEGCEEVSCESGEEGCEERESGSDEGKDKNKKDESNDTCEISCYCQDDEKSECALEKPKPASPQHPQQQQHKPRSEPHDSHPGAATVAGVAAGAAAAAVAGAAAHHENQKKEPQQKPPPPKPQQQPKPEQEQKPKQDDSKCNWCIRDKCNPGACAPKKDFNAQKDAEDLHAAMKGLGTKEKVLIDILTHRSEEQLEQIRQAYQGIGSGGLDDDVSGDTSLKVKKILLALLQSRAEFFAEELNEAFESDNESAMIMILTSLSPCAIKQVGSAYSKKYNNKPLAKAAEDASAFKFEDFLVELIKGNRDKDGAPKTKDAIKDAQALIAAGAGSWFFKGKDTFIDIFTHRSYSQLREIKKQYEIIKPKPGFLEDIEKHSGGGKLTQGLLVMMKNVLNQPRYFADEIEGSLDKPINPFGIRDNNKLVRVLRGRCGLDLGDIRDAYPKNHNNKKLIDRLKRKSIGDYEDVLQAMMEQQPQ